MNFFKPVVMEKHDFGNTKKVVIEGLFLEFLDKEKNRLF